MAALMQACGGSGDAHAQTAAPSDPLEGFWQSTLALQVCTNGAALGGFRGLTTFQAGGAANADNTQPPGTKGTALGAWKRAPTGSYVAELRFWRFKPDGTPDGQQRLTRSFNLAADGKTLPSSVSSVTLDVADNVVRTVCGTETGSRIG
ncbi:MAG: hypothetical protein H7Z19_13760 [Chitinophagaceae bacterium]|nr:hypothetical protein [Rubrivivax sp.]